MEESAENFRRKLEFNGKPFKSKLFYVNVKSKIVRQRAVAYIRDLGGLIETFLTNDIYLFISDSRLPIQRLVKRKDKLSIAEDGTGVGQKQVVPLSRGRALLLKAKHSRNEAQNINCTADVQDKAAEMGLNIEHVHTFLKRCKALGASHKPLLKKHDSFNDITPLKWDDKYFFKVEDDKCHYRPLHKRLESQPRLFAENGSGSPFDGPIVLTKTSTIVPGKSSTTESIAQKGRKSSRFTNNKGGYCEMCQCMFKDSLRTHMKSKLHLQFVRNKENYKALDKIMKGLPKLNAFLFKYIPSKCSNDVLNPISIVSGFQNHNTNDRTNSNCVIEDVVINKNCDNDVTKYKIEDQMKSSEANDNNDQITVQSSLMTNVVHAENRVLTDNSLYVNKNDDFLSEIAFEGELIQGLSNQQTGDDTVCDLYIKGNKPLSHLRTTDCGILSDLLGDDIDEPLVFSELSESDSQTNNLKTLIDNLSIGTEFNSSRLSEGTINVHTSHERAGSLDMSVASESQASSPATCVADCTVIQDRSDDILMSARTPLHVSMETASTYTPRSLKLKYSASAKPNRRVSVREDKTFTYSSHKTSETKLKLCKISTPQNTNLKMFWKVRKTGDCKLVFSAEKRKRFSSSDEDSFDASSNRSTSPIQRHGSKRQKLIF